MKNSQYRCILLHNLEACLPVLSADPCAVLAAVIFQAATNQGAEGAKL